MWTKCKSHAGAQNKTQGDFESVGRNKKYFFDPKIQKIKDLMNDDQIKYTTNLSSITIKNKL